MSARRRVQPRRGGPRPPAVSPVPARPTERQGPAASGAARRRELQELIDLLKQHNLAELEVEADGFRVRLVRESAPATLPAWEGTTSPTEAPPETQPLLPVKDTGGMVTVTSPIVGTFYRSPSPDADPYVEEGDFVKKGQVLCIVEAMKLMNEIEAEVDGRIVKILAESTKPVEYGQPLFLIDPSSSS